MPSCGGGRRRDERAGTLARAAYWGGAGGTLMRTAYLEHGRGIGARHPLGARRIDARPTWSAGVIGCWLATHRSVVTARARDLLGRGRAAATRTRIRTAALSAHQTRRGCCKHAHCVGAEPPASRAPSVERGGIRPRAFAGARQCRRLRAIPAAGPTALQEHQ